MQQLIGEIEFRPAVSEDDFEAAYAIYKQTSDVFVRNLNGGVWPEDERRSFFREGFVQDDMSMLCHNGEIIGCFGIAERDFPVPEEERSMLACDFYRAVVLHRMYIKPEYQRTGIGTAIVNKALQRAHEARLPLELEVLVNNKPAIQAYEKNGYHQYRLIEQGWRCRYRMAHEDTYMYLPTGATAAAMP